jgi:hypothetical protein
MDVLTLAFQPYSGNPAANYFRQLFFSFTSIPLMTRQRGNVWKKKISAIVCRKLSDWQRVTRNRGPVFCNSKLDNNTVVSFRRCPMMIKHDARHVSQLVFVSTAELSTWFSLSNVVGLRAFGTNIQGLWPSPRAVVYYLSYSYAGVDMRRHFTGHVKLKKKKCCFVINIE